MASKENQVFENVVLEMADKHPEMVKMLSETKDKDGKPLFDAANIKDILFNCKKTIERQPDLIKAVLSNPQEIDFISSVKNRGAGLVRAVLEPLPSTIKQNPQIFGEQTESKPKSGVIPVHAISAIKSFDEYFAGYGNGSESAQQVLADAKKVFEALKTPEAIEAFQKVDDTIQKKMVEGLNPEHTGHSFSAVCQYARMYAQYARENSDGYYNIGKKKSASKKFENIRTKLARKIMKIGEKEEQNSPAAKTAENAKIKSFDEYFAGYGNGSKSAQQVLTDAKKVFEALKTPEAIEAFQKVDDTIQKKMVEGLNPEHTGHSFSAVCQYARMYAQYARENSDGYYNIGKKKSASKKFENIRTKLARKIMKIGEKEEQNSPAAKTAENANNIKWGMSKFDDMSR